MEKRKNSKSFNSKNNKEKSPLGKDDIPEFHNSYHKLAYINRKEYISKSKDGLNTIYDERRRLSNLSVQIKNVFYLVDEEESDGQNCLNLISTQLESFSKYIIKEEELVSEYEHDSEWSRVRLGNMSDKEIINDIGNIPLTHSSYRIHVGDFKSKNNKHLNSMKKNNFSYLKSLYETDLGYNEKFNAEQIELLDTIDKELQVLHTIYKSIDKLSDIISEKKERELDELEVEFKICLNMIRNQIDTLSNFETKCKQDVYKHEKALAIWKVEVDNLYKE
jgi:hypothetical protein